MRKGFLPLFRFAPQNEIHTNLPNLLKKGECMKNRATVCEFSYNSCTRGASERGTAITVSTGSGATLGTVTDRRCSSLAGS